ncbi:MAG: hypothetical protein IJO76_04095 [Clostridia bacterium]|nr:hypothetical protein [Clostridia bacterium]
MVKKWIFAMLVALTVLCLAGCSSLKDAQTCCCCERPYCEEREERKYYDYERWDRM